MLFNYSLVKVSLASTNPSAAYKRLLEAEISSG